MMVKNIFLMLYITVYTKDVLSSNILIATYFPIRSHYIWSNAIAEALAARGHNVTMLSPSSRPDKSTKNYRQIVIEDMFGALENYRQWDKVYKMSPLDTIALFNKNCVKFCKFAYQRKGFQDVKAFSKKHKFDLIIFDLTASSCLLPFIQIFNYPPAIGVTTLALPFFLSKIFGNTIQPSYIPHYGLSHNVETNFFYRLENYIMYHVDLLVREFYLRRKLDHLAKEEFGDGIEPIRNLERRISLLFSNIDPVLDNAQPLTPNIIPVGGLHIKTTNNLPEDIQIIMDNAKDGVILFSLGTNIKFNGIKIEILDAILDAIGNLKQIVIWKFDENLPKHPKNVIIKKWLPQSDILAHPNCKLFITHGGALSTFETVHFGVPIIGIPFMVDQHLNVDNLVDKKVAIKIDFMKLTSELLLGSIKEVLHNYSYSSNMMVLSRRLRDKIETPMDKAIYWIEYAIRHNGTHFLDPASRDQSFFVSTCTDIKLFLLALLVFITLLVKRVLKYFKYLLRKNTSKKNKSE